MFGVRDLFHGEREGRQMPLPQENKRDKNIFGVELEVNDRESWGAFTEAVDNNVICIPHNLDEYKRKYTHAIVKPDCTAEYEVILQAERPRNLLLKLKQMNEFLSPETVHNLTAGEHNYRNDCSAHIHFNNRYINKIGVRYSELVRVTELLAPYLYLLSGRDYNQIGSKQWARSYLDDHGHCDVYAHPKIRAEYLDDISDERLTYDWHGERYYIMNTPTSHGTSELRFFTNKCSFDYNRIKIFIEISEFLIDTASNYQGIPYTECYEEIVCDFAAFLSKYKRRREEMKKAQLDFIYHGVEGYNKFLVKHRLTNISSINNNISLGRLIRNMREIERNSDITYDQPINLAHIDIEEIQDYYIERLSDDIIDNAY